MKGNVLLLLVLSAVLAAGSPAQAAPSEAVTLDLANHEPRDLQLRVGQSQIIMSPTPLEQAVIGSPEVADIKLLSSQRVLVLGIKPGTTNLIMRPKGDEQNIVMSVTVAYDRNGIKRKIAETMPGEDHIEIRDSNDKVIMTGQASSASSMEMALAIARSFVPADSVVNLMQVAGSQQVMLETRIAEVARNSLKDLGISTLISNNGGKFQAGTGLPIAGPFANISYLNLGNVFDRLEINLQALEQQGLAKTLAEPNLVALSGAEANFLAGGEIPIPVSQAAGLSNAITIEYKEFGVGLRFTPTVLDSDRINLKLVSEVSSLDTTNAFSIGNGISVPAISTRRAGSTIELGDGQSFAVAGLIQSNMKNAYSQLPILGNIPVLGALFRSTNFQRDESELVVIVTAHLVKPVNKALLASPTDVFVPPSDIDQYLLGNLEGKPLARRLPVPTQSGFDGSFGHQLDKEYNHAH